MSKPEALRLSAPEPPPGGWPYQVMHLPKCPACGETDATIRTSRPAGKGYRTQHRICRRCETLFGVRVVL